MATISFDLPDSVERHLATLSDNVDAAAKEAAVVELYRQGQLSHGALAECLGMTRTEVDSLLTRHGVTEDLPTVAEFREQLEAIRNRLRRWAGAQGDPAPHCPQQLNHRLRDLSDWAAECESVC